MGTVFVLSHIAVIGLAIAGGLKFAMKRAAKSQTEDSKRINKFIYICYRPYHKLRHWLTWHVLIRSMLEMYLEMILCSTVIITTMNWTEKPNDRMNCLHGLLYFAICMAFPIGMLVFYSRHKDRLFQRTWRYKYGGGYEGMKEPSSLEGELRWRRRAYVSSIVMPMIFVARRIIFAFSVVWIDPAGDGGTGLLPLLWCFWTIWITIEFLVHAMPFAKDKNTYMEVFNEITLLLLMCLLLGFTSWMPVVHIEDSLIK